MYKFQKESWAQKLLSVNLPYDYTTSSHTIGCYYTSNDVLGYKKALEVRPPGRPRPKHNFLDSSTAGQCLSWPGPWNYHAQNSRQNTTLYKTETSKNGRLSPLSVTPEVRSSSAEPLDVMTAAGKANLKPISEPKVKKRKYKGGVPNNRVFDVDYKPPWKYTIKNLDIIL